MSKRAWSIRLEGARNYAEKVRHGTLEREETEKRTSYRPRDIQFNLDDFKTLGVSEHCRECTALRLGDHGTIEHTPACRNRMLEAIRARGSEAQKERLRKAEERVNQWIAEQIEARKSVCTLLPLLLCLALALHAF